MPFGKRIDGPNGHRSAVREPVVLRAAVICATESRTAALMDVSARGAKLHVFPLPSVGREVLIRVGKFEAFGSIVWASRGSCGVQFESPISESDVQLLREERGIMTLSDVSADEALGAQDWANGMVR